MAFVVAVITAPLTQRLIYEAAKLTYNLVNTAYQYGSNILASKKPVNLPSWNKLTVDMEHILSGHTPNGSRNPDGKKSIFYGMTAEQILRAIKEAYNNCSKLQTQGDRVLLEGFSESYNLLVQIWVNLTTRVIETAYPVG